MPQPYSDSTTRYASWDIDNIYQEMEETMAYLYMKYSQIFYYIYAEI